MSTFPTKEKALGMYKKMYTIRKYEESIYYLFLEGIMPGSIHQSTGEEASAVGMLYDLGKDDWMATTHRPAGHDIAKGVSVKSMMCEMFGKAEGCCKGKGGAMHTGDISVGAMTANAIVGGDLPIAAGAALAFKMQKKPNVVVCFLGDGATNEGSYHETMNAVGLWKLPVIYVCENNLFSANTSIKLTCCQENVAAGRAEVYLSLIHISEPTRPERCTASPARSSTATTSWPSTRPQRAPLPAPALVRAPRSSSSRPIATAAIPATTPAATAPRTRRRPGSRTRIP